MRPPGGASWRSVSCSASTKTGSLVYCAIPFPRRNGRYARSRSRIRQPSIVVSSVSTIAEQPQRSARDDEALDELVRRAPVELEPARRVAHRRARSPPSGARPGSRRRTGCPRPQRLARPRRRRRGAPSRARRSGRGRTGSTAAFRGPRRPSRASRRRGASAGRSASARTRRGSRASSPRCRRRPRRRRSPPATCASRAAASSRSTRRERSDTRRGRRRRRPRTGARARSRRTCEHPNRGRRENRGMSSYPTAKRVLDKARLARAARPALAGLRLPLRRDGARHALAARAIAARGSTASGGSRVGASSTS